MADRFHVPGPIPVGEFVLDGPEAHHLARVRRFTQGDRVILFNGDGREYPAEVLSTGRQSVVLTVLEGVEADREVGFDLVVASAVPKGDRADFLVEKLTELGATRFIPLVTARSVVVPKATAKFERAVIEASKQCGRNRLMTVDPPTPWAALVGSTNLPLLRLILHTGGGMPIGQLDPKSVRRGVVVAVGPEGGFEADEIAADASWHAISLGPRILRVETAALAAAAWLGLSNPASAT